MYYSFPLCKSLPYTLCFAPGHNILALADERPEAGGQWL